MPSPPRQSECGRGRGFGPSPLSSFSPGVESWYAFPLQAADWSPDAFRKKMWRRWCTGGAAGGCGFGSIHFHVQRGGPYYLVLPFREVIMHEAITKKRLPPSAARKAECRNCLNTDRLMNPCESRVCELNKTGKSILKRIKAHCISCVPEQTIYGVKACTGQVINPTPHICPLWSFRLGRNPVLQGRKGNSEALRRYREMKEQEAVKIL